MRHTRSAVFVIWVVFMACSGAFAKKAAPAEIVLSKPVFSPMPEYPADLVAAGKGGVVESIVGVDVYGSVIMVVAVESPEEALKEPTVQAIKKWRFTPTLVNGAPEKYYFIVPIEFSAGEIRLGQIRDEDPADRLPKVKKLVLPTYPEELRDYGNTGTVWVEIIIDRHGKLLAPRVTKSTHPAFEQPALEAILKWTFAPATSHGKPIYKRVIQPVKFVLDYSGGAEGYSISKTPGSKGAGGPKLTAMPTPRTTVFAVHPYDEAIAGKGGNAEVKCLIGPDGSVLATQVLSASKAEFGESLAAALETWTFEPAESKGEHVQVVLSWKREFAIGGRDSAIDDETGYLIRKIRKKKFAPANIKELDAPLRPKFTVAPHYPAALMTKTKEGSATIEVVVDKRGHAVLPRIVEASEPDFGWSAATAAQRWLFEPPKVNGKAVEVMVRIPFGFTLPDAPAPAATN